MDVSPEGALFVTGSEDGILRLGESATGRVTVSYQIETKGGKKCGPDWKGQLIFSFLGDGKSTIERVEGPSSICQHLQILSIRTR